MKFLSVCGMHKFEGQRNDYEIVKLHPARWQLTIRSKKGGRPDVSDHKTQFDAVQYAEEQYKWRK